MLAKSGPFIQTFSSYLCERRKKVFHFEAVLFHGGQQSLRVQVPPVVVVSWTELLIVFHLFAPLADGATPGVATHATETLWK